MSDRYFSDSHISGDRVLLRGAEAHHLAHVKRARPAARVTLFDGSGLEFPARVERIGRGEVELAVLGREAVDRELPIRIDLAVSLPKGDRQKWLVEKAVELGVARIVPLLSTRSVAQPVEQALGRLRRAVIEASKQCGRNRLLEIAKPRAWADFATKADASAVRLLAHPGRNAAQPGRLPLPKGDDVPEPIILAIGPEGGLTPEEIALALAAGWQAVCLGPRILRIETAALALVAMVVRDAST